MNPDITSQDIEYWNNVLKSHGLSMRRGERVWMDYGHDYEKDDWIWIENGNRRVDPHQTLAQQEKDLQNT